MDAQRGDDGAQPAGVQFGTPEVFQSLWAHVSLYWAGVPRPLVRSDDALAAPTR